MAGAARGVRLVLVTDRRLMGAPDGDPAAFASAIARAVAGLPPGVALVQVREKDLGGRDLVALVRAAIAATPHQRVVVNDRVDVALAAGAAGVHLPEDGLDFAAAERAIAATGLIIGGSRHTAARAAQAALAGVDLVHFGPIWATPSKAGLGEPLGAAALTEARGLIGDRARLVAVGGIDGPDRAAAARAAGADAVAVIRFVWRAADPAAAAAALL